MSKNKYLDTLSNIISYGLTCLIVEQIESQLPHITKEAQENCKDILAALKGKPGEGYRDHSKNYPSLLPDTDIG